jgi:hypothetical protein
MGSGGIAPLLFISILVGGEWSASCPCSFTPGKQPTMSTEQEAEWAPELLWTLWNKRKILPLLGTESWLFSL